MKKPILHEFGLEEVSSEILISTIDKETYKSGAGGVYMIRVGEFTKIGYSTCLFNRMISLQSGCPYELELIFFLKSDFPADMERCLHELLKEKRHHNEWFLLTNDDVLKAVQFVEETWKELITQQHANGKPLAA